jgi:hypothetical protein
MAGNRNKLVFSILDIQDRSHIRRENLFGFVFEERGYWHVMKSNDSDNMKISGEDSDF